MQCVGISFIMMEVPSIIMLSLVCLASSDGSCSEKDVIGMVSLGIEKLDIRVVQILRVAFISMQRLDLALMSSFQRSSKDVSESFHLLLELLTSEQQCFQMVEKMCLSRDIEFTVSGGQPPASDFKAFINRH